MESLAPDLAGRGITEAAWGRSPWLRNLPRRSPQHIWGAARRLVLVSPHPDDEVLGCGGLLHYAGRYELPVLVVAVTDGEACYPHHSFWTRERLREVRRVELAGALAELEIQNLTLVHLQLPDSQVADSRQPLTDALCTILRPGDLPLVTWRSDGHTDHEASAQATLTAARRQGLVAIQFPIWAWHWLDPDHGPPEGINAFCYALDTPAYQAKTRAIAHFHSQLPHSELGETKPILPAHIAARFQRDFEVLFDTRD